MDGINPNLRRRKGPALLLAAAAPLLHAALWALRPRSAPSGVFLFQSYQVGDFFMALPAIRRLHRGMPVTVLCRPDCAFVLRRLGIPALPCVFPFLARPSLPSFFASLREARRLRGRLGGAALDFHSDPRTAFFLKLAGTREAISYRRPAARFFDRLLPLSPAAVHQGEKDMDLAMRFLEERGKHAGDVSHELLKAGPSNDPPGTLPDEPVPPPAAAPAATRYDLLLSCWTRKEEKNWPLSRWDEVLNLLLARGRRPAVIVPPDGDSAFRDFRARWDSRLEFIQGDLEEIHDRARDSAAVIALDNFLGHLGAHFGKPVFWINGSSDPEHVRPRGAAVVQKDPMPCRPCGHRCINPVHLQCLLELRTTDVLPKLDAWLTSLPEPGA